jgi:anaerobic magnesium-protoporphyrin IX monomethyl ester cyclase
MAEILISNTYFLALDPKQHALMQPYPPLATLYATAVLEKENHVVTFFDTIFAESHELIFPLIDKHANKVFVIYDDGFNYLTKMCLVNMRNACFAMIKYAKSKGCTVLVSSSDATDHKEDYLATGADFILIGEAENTLLELVTAISESHTSRINDIKGIAFKSDGQVVKTVPREVMHDLDSLPFPAWQHINIDQYKQRWINRNGYFSLNMTTTRGCPFKCNWCAKPIYGNRYNSRSPENVVEEISMLIANYGVQHFWFCDDIFGLKPGWIKKFSELVQEKNLVFKFKIQCRADLLLDTNNIDSLAKAGCDEVWIGAESGSQKVLDAMDKGTTIEQIYQSTQLMKAHSIKPCFFLQFGYLGETKSDINQTIKMLLDLMPHDIGISVSYPLPGTKFYEMVKNDLHEKQNWNDSDELLMMYKSTFSPAYYKQLHRYVHRKYRLAQGKQNLQKIASGNFHLSKKEMRRIATMPYFTLSGWWSKSKLAKLE